MMKLRYAMASLPLLAGVLCTAPAVAAGSSTFTSKLDAVSSAMQSQLVWHELKMLTSCPYPACEACRPLPFLGHVLPASHLVDEVRHLWQVCVQPGRILPPSLLLSATAASSIDKLQQAHKGKQRWRACCMAVAVVHTCTTCACRSAPHLPVASCNDKVVLPACGAVLLLHFFWLCMLCSACARRQRRHSLLLTVASWQSL